MKKAVLGFIILFLTQVLFAQQKVEWVNVDEIIENCLKYEKEGEFEQALEEVNKIPQNDSIYLPSLTSKAYYLLGNEKYEEAIIVCEEGMNAEDHPNKYYFYLNSGAAYLGLEEFEKAIKVFDKALLHYPKNHKFYYNKGLAYEGLKEFDKASQMYQTSITYNPFYANSHLKLGALCYKEHHITQAMMCLSMYLLINPDGENSFNVLNAYNNMVEIQNDSEATPDLVLSKDDESFEELDLIINNLAALSPKYKISNKLVIPLIKQNHAMINQLENYEGEGGFWDRYYVPFYKFIGENDHFDDFSYTIAFSVKNEKYKSIVNKHISDIKKFINIYQSKWKEIVGKNEAIINGEKKPVTYLYKNSIVDGYGEYVNKLPVGIWHIYNDYGGLSSVGGFDTEGKKHGNWIWYDNIGNVTEKGEYDHGKAINEYFVYYDNGKLNVQATYVDDKLEGKLKKYSTKGALLESSYFKDDQKNGEYISNFSIGEGFVDYKINYVDGKADGVVYEYYPDGILKSEMPFKEGKKEGIEKRFFHNGQIESQKVFVDDKLEGEYIEYYSNGNIYQKGLCSDGWNTGEWKTYHSDGNIYEELTYDKGKITGTLKSYDTDGILNSEFTYRKGEVIAYQFYNKSQKIIKQAKKQNGEFYYQGHAPNGNIITNGRYSISGGKKGKWKYYTDNNLLTSTDNNNEGMLEGVSTSYYPNGEVMSLAPYKNDTLSGYYSEFYSNGQLQEQGWYKNGVKEGDWVSYYHDGTIESKNYYTNGKLYGFSEKFAVDGKLTRKYHYRDGSLIKEYHYDTTGNVFNEVTIAVDSATYKVITKFANGNIASVADMLYRKKHGNYLGYNFNGGLRVEGHYFNGERDSIWSWYHNNGKLETQGVYDYGDKQGLWTDYYEDGEVEKESNFKDGYDEGIEKNFNENGVLTQSREHSNGLIVGEVRFYSEEGELQLIRYYNNDRLIGYSYMNENSEILPMIPVKNETAKIIGYFNNSSISREMEMIKGLFHNKYVEYYYNGQVCEDQNYYFGANDGPDIFYFPDGTIKEERNYNRGILIGDVNSYYPNGQLKTHSVYVNGSKHGKSTKYDESGKLIEETVYFNGTVVSQIMY
ncbi:MAG: hypothetical protein HQ521_02845 [Bacteroidetes bacterium]|nr:hypothetical protein [Bacteroidota bacterium]